jgi:renalase
MTEHAQSSSNHREVLVIGAGLAGLMAAVRLQSQGKRVTVLEKDRTVGGRIATLAIGGGLADHGAQFFTARSKEFKALVDQWLREGLAFLWSYGWASGSLAPVTAEGDGHPRYAVRDGMNAIARHYSQQLEDVRLNITVTAIHYDGKNWHVRDESGGEYIASALILTPPVPQSLALLDAGQVTLNPQDRAALDQIEYTQSLTGILVLDKHILLPAPGAIQQSDARISWIANNRQKGISNTTVITAQANGEFSTQMFGESDERVLMVMRDEMRYLLPSAVRIREAQLKRWRYSQPKSVYPEACLVAKDLPPLVFAGDAFGGPRVEGAVLSGLAAARALG